MDGQQVFVTGADGEQMVLSGPEAAALLAQAGISLGDQEQVMMGTGEDQAAPAVEQPSGGVGAEEGGNILVPEGSSVGEDGSIIAADGTILAPAGTVLIGEDGTLMMAENSSLLSSEAASVSAPAMTSSGAVFTTADGGIIKTGEENILTDADGNVLTDQDGNILTTADLGALGVSTSSASVTSSAPTTMTTSDGNVFTSDGNFLRTADGNLLTDEEGNFLTPEGNIIKPEEAHKILANQGVSVVENNDNKVEPMELQTNMPEEQEANKVEEAEKMEAEGKVEPVATPSDTVVASDEKPPELLMESESSETKESSEPKLMFDLPKDETALDTENNALEPEKSKLEEAEEPAPVLAQSEVQPETSQSESAASLESLEPVLSGETDLGQPEKAEESAVEAAVLPPATETNGVNAVNHTVEELTGELAAVEAEGAVTAVMTSTADILSAATAEVTGGATTVSSVPVPAPPQPQSSDGGIYTTSDGRVLSLPDGIVTNAAGHLINPADGSILTTEDGTPLMLPEGSLVTSSMETTPVMNNITNSLPPSSVQSLLTSDDGTMITAPEGSMIATDGSIIAADGTILAPPGSVSLTPEPQHLLPTQPLPPSAVQQHQQQQQQQQQQPQNLIGLQLPESGEVLYLDPADPAAQQLLQEAGIHLGEGGVLQTIDGQVLSGEDGNPITTNNKASLPPVKQNNLVGDAAAAAGLDTTDIDIPLSASQVVTEIRPNLPIANSSYGRVSEAAEQKTVQPRYTQRSGPAKTQYKKLTFNSGAAGASYASPAPIQKRSIAPKQRRPAGVPNTDLQIGPDQQKVTYTVTSENGYTQTYMMICSKSLDQNTLINTLIKNISSDPNHKGKKTIKITQHKYGAKKTPKQQPRSYGAGQRQAVTGGSPGQRQVIRQQPGQQQKLAPAPQRVQQVQYRAATAAPVPATITPAPAPVPVKQQSPMKPPQQLLQSENDIGDFGNNLSLEDIMKQVVDSPTHTPSTTITSSPATTEDKDPKVNVRCNYCTNFRCVLNSQTWENILNHILPVAKEELHCSFYGNILKHFARGLKVSVTGGREQCEVVVSHGLVCRRTGAWYSVDKPGVELATTLASHIAAVQPGVSGPYGARPRGNSLICLFCSSPYTAEDYQRHLKPHEDFIVPCLLLAAGAYCATSFELDIKKTSQDLRFLPCTKFATDFNCSKKLQATVDCFRENFDSRGFLQVSNSAMTKCSVCRTPNNTYCALFKPNASTMKIFGGNSEEMLSVCANCQKQFVNVVMRENSFEKQLKMFQLHHMEQLCGMLRVLLSASQAICSGSHNLLYTVQEGGSLYNASNTIHTVSPAKIIMNPVNKIQKLEEDKSCEVTGPCVKYCCEQCKFSIDLTRLQHNSDKSGHLVDMAVGVVLEHVVPHTESLMAVIMTAATNELFKLKFEFTASVEGEGINKKIAIGLDRKIVTGDGVEVTLQKDVHKTIELLRTKLKQDKKGNVTVRRRHLFLDKLPDNESGQLMEAGKFLEAASNLLQLYGSCGCNTKLLDYYAECRLCSKFSFPDFRLTAAIKNKAGVALCENCCETILSLCVPSEPERLSGKGDVCLLLGVERSTGHRLVLSNNTKKWISAEGVNKIKAVSEISASCTMPDYSTSLVQLLKSHLQAVAERAWTDSSCMTARAGFCVTGDNSPDITNHQAPIEVKVSIKPPKPKTPPPKLVITPVNSKPSPSSRLVKITANRRIIPVRDPTSISTPPRVKGTIIKADSAKLTTVKVKSSESPKQNSKAAANSGAKGENKEEEIDSDLEKEDDFESIDAIANFISSSEPPVKKLKEEKPSNEVTDALTDEFTDTGLSTPKRESNGKTPESLIKLPAGTVVTNMETTEEERGPPTDTANTTDTEELKLPPGLVISPAQPGMVKLQAGCIPSPAQESKLIEVGASGPRKENNTESDKTESKNVIELGSPKTEIVPSPASDATTSTKDTVTPSKSTSVTSKGKKPTTPRAVVRDETNSEDAKGKDEKTSTVNNKKEAEQEPLTSLDVDIDNEDLDEDEENNDLGSSKKASVKLSSILPKPNKSRNSTPASSSKKGMPGRPVGRPSEKRKRAEAEAAAAAAAASKPAKKAKLSEEEEEAPDTPEQDPEAPAITSQSSSSTPEGDDMPSSKTRAAKAKPSQTNSASAKANKKQTKTPRVSAKDKKEETSSSGRVRRTRKIFDL